MFSSTMSSTKLYVTGTQRSGKTTLVKALLDDTDSSNISFSPSFTSSSSTSSTSSSASAGSKTSESVHIYRWVVGKGRDEKAKDNNADNNTDNNVIDVWDLPGHQVYQEAHMIYYTSPSLFLVVDDVEGNHTELIKILTLIQNKCPSSHVIIALTHGDQLASNDNKEVTKRTEGVANFVSDWLEQRKLSIKRHIGEIKLTVKESVRSEDDGTGKVDERALGRQLTEPWKVAVKTSLSLHETVFSVCPVSGVGISELRQAVIDKATDGSIFTHTREIPETSVATQVLACALAAKEAEEILLSWSQFSEMVKKRLSPEILKQSKTGTEGEISKAVDRLQSSGRLLDIHLHEQVSKPVVSSDNNTTGVTTESDSSTSSSISATTTTTTTTTTTSTVGSQATSSSSASTTLSQRFICVYPEAFINMICNCLITKDNKTFRIEATRFWPTDSGYKPPDPRTLARVLEAIPLKGLIREAVLPIIWQDFDLSQSQIQLAVHVLERLGVLSPHTPLKTNCAGLAMPAYPSLSPTTCYVSIIMDLVPDNRPQLNWTSKPFDGDIQVTWRLKPLSTVADTGVKRAFAVVRWAFHNCCLYSHLWNHGLLIKFVDATVCLEETSDTLDIACRVNGDEPGQEEMSVQLLWVHLVSVVKTLEDFFTQHMPGVLFRASLALYGGIFYNTDKLSHEPELSLVKCLIAKRTGNSITTKDREVERSLDLDLLFPFHGEELSEVWTPSDFKTFVLNKREQILREHSAQCNIHSGQDKVKGSQPHRKSTRRRKVVEVKWKKDIVEEVKQEIRDMTQTQASLADPESTTTQNGLDSSPPAVPDSSDVSTTEVLSNLPSTTTPPSSSTSSSSSSDALPSATSTSFTKEDWTKEAEKVASRFVAAMMASGVAKYVSTYADVGPDRSHIVSTAEVTAAKVTADAALAVHSGDLEGAARAVIDAVKAVQSATASKLPDRQSSVRGSPSKVCTLL